MCNENLVYNILSISNKHISIGINYLKATIDYSDILAIVDSREKTPLDLSPIQSKVGTLTTGDYSVFGLEMHISVERKSLPDIVSCCGSERDRFSKEIKRLLAYSVRAVVIEASWDDIKAGDWRSSLTPNHVIGSIIGWSCMGVPFFMAGNDASDIVSRILLQGARKKYSEIYQMLKHGVKNGL